jgi:lysophospholipase L1-like esterase
MRKEKPNMNHGRRHAGWAVAVLGLLSMRVFAAETSQQQAADPKAYLAHVSDLFKKEWPANRTVNIVCHGHSVPAGYFRTPAVDSPNAYPHLLFMGLKERFPVAVINVIVTAIGGENSSGGAARFEKDVLACKPDVVTIDYGLNDRGLGLERTRTNLVSMIKKSQEQNVAVILLTPTADTGAKVDNPNDPLNQQAELIRSLSKEYRVALVDSLDLFQDAIKNGTKLDDLMSQGNHPNRKGHDLVAERLLDWFPQ